MSQTCGTCLRRRKCMALMCHLRDDSPCDFEPSRYAEDLFIWQDPFEGRMLL